MWANLWLIVKPWINFSAVFLLIKMKWNIQRREIYLRSWHKILCWRKSRPPPRSPYPSNHWQEGQEQEEESEQEQSEQESRYCIRPIKQKSKLKFSNVRLPLNQYCNGCKTLSKLVSDDSKCFVFVCKKSFTETFWHSVCILQLFSDHFWFFSLSFSAPEQKSGSCWKFAFQDPWGRLPKTSLVVVVVLLPSDQ